MKKILLATHLTFAKAILDSLQFIAGEQPFIEALCAYTSEIPDMKAAAKEYVDRLEPEDELIVVTDVYGGSVNNEFMKYIERPGFYLIAGLNLALLLELIAGMNMETSEQIRTAIENSGGPLDCKAMFTQMHLETGNENAAGDGI